MKDLLFKYGAVIGARYTKSQKKIFLDKVIDEIHSKNIKVDIKRKKIGVKECVHCVINDLAKSEYVVMAAYDTPSKTLLKNSSYYPFNTKLNKKNQSKELGIRAIISIVGIILLSVLVYGMSYTSFPITAILLIVSLIIAYFTFNIIRGKANKFNMNRNSAAVSLLLDMAINHRQANVSYILLDEACESQIGFASIKEEVKNKKVIILDCLASGSTLVKATFKDAWSKDIAFSKDVNVYVKTYEKDNKYNLVLNIFDDATYFGCGEINDGQYIVEQGRTKEDYHVDLQKLEKIRESLLESMKG